MRKRLATKNEAFSSGRSGARSFSSSCSLQLPYSLPPKPQNPSIRSASQVSSYSMPHNRSERLKQTVPSKTPQTKKIRVWRGSSLLPRWMIALQRFCPHVMRSTPLHSTLVLPADIASLYRADGEAFAGRVISAPISITRWRSTFCPLQKEASIAVLSVIRLAPPHTSSHP